MPWGAPIAGWVTRLGYLWCAGCAPERPTGERVESADGRYPVAVSADSDPHAYEVCDRCHRPLVPRRWRSSDNIQLPLHGTAPVMDCRDLPPAKES